MDDDSRRSVPNSLSDEGDDPGGNLRAHGFFMKYVRESSLTQEIIDQNGEKRKFEFNETG